MFYVRRLSLLAMVLVLSSVAIGQATPPPTTDQTAPHGKVLFSRDQDSPAVEKAAKPPAKQPSSAVSDAERSSLTFTAYDLDVHLTPAQSHLAVHAGFTVRNSGKEPLTRLVFQISSSLHWESFAMRSGGRVSPLSFTEQTIDTDADHTGKATEAVVSLPQPLATRRESRADQLLFGRGDAVGRAAGAHRSAFGSGCARGLGPDQPGMDRDCADSGTFCGIRLRLRRFFLAMERSSFRALGRPSCSRRRRRFICG